MQFDFLVCALLQIQVLFLRHKLNTVEHLLPRFYSFQGLEDFLLTALLKCPATGADLVVTLLM